MKGMTLMTLLFFVTVKTSDLWMFGQAKLVENIDKCNVTNDGREFVCRGMGFQSIDDIFKMNELKSMGFNITKM